MAGIPDDQENKWRLTKEKLLVYSGLLFAVATFVAAEVGLSFHPEFLIFAGGLCGLGLTRWGDKNL